MKIEDLRSMTDEELIKELETLRKNLFNIRSKKVTDVEENPAMIRATKRDIARVLTILKERSLKGRRDEKKEETSKETST
jgi:large subunit ribosomal protein L29